jgi:small multidrug resistance pump
VLKQPLDLPALVGIGLIVAGVAVIQLFSKASAH